MLKVRDFYAALDSAGIRRFCGVPDSTLNDLVWYLVDRVPPDRHRVCPNEGSAIALAAGHYLGTGEPTCVYLQNSGLGNAVNPLASLADPEVFGVPMLLIVGWRGVPGQPDEPQHVKQGRITLDQLDVLEIPHWVLPTDPDAVTSLVGRALAQARERQGPVALVVKPKTFAPYRCDRRADERGSMTREAAIGTIVESVGGDAFIVATTGKASRELYERRRALGQDNGRRDFLTVGSMGHASQIALGLAETHPGLRVICLDGDGAVLMHLGGLAMIAARAHQGGATNLLHLVIDNGTHDSVGGLPTCGERVDLPALAMACGYRSAERVDTATVLAARLRAFRTEPGPALLAITVRSGARADLGRPGETPRENMERFMAEVRAFGCAQGKPWRSEDPVDR